MSDEIPRDGRARPDAAPWADEAQSTAHPGHDDAPVAGDAPPASTERAQGMVPTRAHRRTKVERGLMRLVATAGIVAVAVVLGAVLASQDVAGWIIGLVIGLVTVILAALLWSSREL